MSNYSPGQIPAYLSSNSANALISDLRPTSISTSALYHINLLLDELLFSLVSSSQSLNPSDLRCTGVPAVFTGEKGEFAGSRALGRSAIGEAELELRSWIESNGALGKEGFGRDGKGSGMRNGGRFPVGLACDVMRSKCAEFSTLAGDDMPSPELEEERLDAWRRAGGSEQDNVLSPAALYLTAIIEHVCENILASLNRIVGRDSSKINAGLEDLYTALAEDDTLWGIFRRMNSRVILEEAVKARQKRSLGGRASPAAGAAASQTSLVTSTSAAQASAPGPATKKSSLPPPTSFDNRASVESPRHNTGSVHGSIRKSPSLQSTSKLASQRDHTRSPSVLSANTRSIIGAYNDQAGEEGGHAKVRSKQDEEDDFDALVRSGETMKVSLTPSRLKTFDVSGKKSQPSSPQHSTFSNQSQSRDRKKKDSSISRNSDLPPLLPQSSSATGRDPAETVSPSSVASRSRRSGSNTSSPQVKLQARAPTTIAEKEAEEELRDEDDEPYAAAAGTRKESLKELFADGGPEPSPDSTPTKPGKRTVPAVILGSPPPQPQLPNERFDSSPAKSALAGGGASINRPARPARLRTTNVDEIPTAPAPERMKRKTEAQEMADFFNEPPPVAHAKDTSGESATVASSTGGGGRKKSATQDMADFFNYTHPPSSPPGKYGPPVENIAPRKGGGLKGFMSKIGSRSQKEKDRKAAVEDTLHEIPTAGGMGWTARKQKSVGSFATGGMTSPQEGEARGGGDYQSAKDIASAYREQQNTLASADQSQGHYVFSNPPPLPPSHGTSDISPPNLVSPNKARSSSLNRRAPPPPVSDESGPLPPSAPAQSQALSQSPVSPGGATSPLVGLGIGSGAGVGAAAVTRKPSSRSRKPVPYSSTDEPGTSSSPETPSHPTFASMRNNSGSVPSSPARRQPPVMEEPGLEGSGGGAGAGAGAVSGPPSAKWTELRDKPSDDQLSFKTADEQLGTASTPTPARSVVGPEVDGVAAPATVAQLEEPSQGSSTPAAATVNGTIDSVPEAADLREVGTGRKDEVDTSLDTVPEGKILRTFSRPEERVDTEKDAPASTTAISSNAAVNSGTPAIPLTDLVPLRRLLEHATTARECQLLLSAVLTQWGVPLGSAPGHTAGEVEMDPESRVTAWLLAGREGPVGYPPSAPDSLSHPQPSKVAGTTAGANASASESHEDDTVGGEGEEELRTPTTAHQAATAPGDRSSVPTEHTESTGPAGLVKKVLSAVAAGAAELADKIDPEGHESAGDGDGIAVGRAQ